MADSPGETLQTHEVSGQNSPRGRVSGQKSFERPKRQLNLVGIWLEFGWNLVGIRLEFGWNLVGIWLEFGWNLVGIRLEFGWNSVGIWLEFLTKGQGRWAKKT